MKEEFFNNLKIVWSEALKAYLDSYMYLIALDLKLKHDFLRTNSANNFQYLYTFYVIQRRLIISTKSIIEPCKSNKINLDYIIKELSNKDEFLDVINDYNNLFKSKEAKAIKSMRDNIVHPLKDSNKAMCLCKDFMFVLSESLRILVIINTKFNIKVPDNKKIIEIFSSVSKKYWQNIISLKIDEDFYTNTHFIQELIDNPLE